VRRTAAKDLATVSRGVRVRLESEAKGAAVCAHGPEQYERDIRRQTLTGDYGWLEVRVSKSELTGDRPAVVHKVRAALESRGWRTR
jgi:very-short-patch-repair endonuclease